MAATASIRGPFRRVATTAVLLAILALEAGGQSAAGVAECDPPKPVGIAEGPGPTPVELELEGRTSQLTVSPAGRLWLTTYMGNTYHADSVGAYWPYGPIQRPPTDSMALMGDQLDAATFFTPDTAFIWGNIGVDYETDRGLVLRTTDGGATWDSVSIAGGGWIHDAVANAAGEAWMGGSSGRLLYTADFGASWTVRSRPFRSQLIAIAVGAGGVGLAGSIDEGLRITRDGGTTWRSVPTPQQQRRYPPPPREEETTELDTLNGEEVTTVPERMDEDTAVVVLPLEGERAAKDTFPEPQTDGGQDRIDRVGLFRGRAVVTQGGRVFHSALDSIDWQPLPGDSLALFAVSRDGAGLAGVTHDGRLVRYDSELRPAAAPGARMRGRPLDLVVQGGVLHALDEQGRCTARTNGGSGTAIPSRASTRCAAWRSCAGKGRGCGAPLPTTSTPPTTTDAAGPGAATCRSPSAALPCAARTSC